MTETKLTGKQEWLLREALHRYVQFYAGEELTVAWTGLGFRTDYKPVLNAGLMTWACDKPRHYQMGWLRLTEAGAKIVQGWLDEEATGTIIDEILERRESLQHLAQPPSTIALKAVTEVLQEHDYVVIARLEEATK